MVSARTTTILLLLSLLVLSGCISIPAYPVKTELLSETVDAPVDSEIARYYLSSYFKGHRSNPEFDRKIHRLYREQGQVMPDRRRLKEVAERFSTDFAALFFADYLMQQPENRNAQQRFRSYLSQPPSQLYQPPSSASQYRVLFVPGWNYIDNGDITGSNLAMPRRLVSAIGIDNELILTPANGSVEAIADVLQQAIVKQSDSGKRLIIVGASAAGPAIHLTLGKRLSANQLQSVAAWINLGGILQGSPLVDYFNQWPQKALLNLVLWFKGWEHQDIISMSTPVSRQRFASLRLPSDLLVLNYLALSLSGNLSDLSRYKYPFIRDLGPNDGLTLLPDAIAPDSISLISVNSDHYFGQDPNIEDKTIAVMKTVLDLLQLRDTPVTRMTHNEEDSQPIRPVLQAGDIRLDIP